MTAVIQTARLPERARGMKQLLLLVPLLSAVQHLLSCEMTAVCLTLSSDEHNHLSIQEHTADVQPDNELGCDICCQWMLAQSCTEVGWLVVTFFSYLLVPHRSISGRHSQEEREHENVSKKQKFA